MKNSVFNRFFVFISFFTMCFFILSYYKNPYVFAKLMLYNTAKFELIEDSNVDDIIGTDNVIYEQLEEQKPTQPNKKAYGLKDLYLVDRKTSLTDDVYNFDKLKNKKIKFTPSTTEPKILIFHTHSQEMYADSKDETEGIVMVGEKLKEVLEKKYNVKVLHNTQKFDVVDGKTQRLGAYDRMEGDIEKILKQNPSIEVTIDLHRDGVNENTRLVTEVDGKQMAKIMFFNGLSQIYKNSKIEKISYLPNKNLEANLALSLQAQLFANQKYPNLMRKIYINAYRYSLYFLPNSMLIELGAQTNTKQEALNSVEPLADILYSTLTKNS